MRVVRESGRIVIYIYKNHSGICNTWNFPILRRRNITVYNDDYD